jgi:nucleoside-diphosphate-sugar epimerase
MGYVGPSVVRLLRESRPDAALLGFDAGYFAHCLTGARTLPERELDCQFFGDVRRVPARALQGVDAVVHLAAVSNDPIGNAYDEATLSVNYRATARLARQARDAGVRSFVFASSCSVYGVAQAGLASESSRANPLTPYARSKLLAERSLARLADEGFAVTSLRFGTACGMSERLRLDLVLNDFVASAIAEGRITILSDGSPWRPLIHVSDMARAIDWALGRPAGDDDAFLAVNVGSAEWNYRILDLAEEVAVAIPGVEVALTPASGPDRRSYRVSFELFESLAPAHQPRTTLAEAVRDLRDGLRAIGFRDRGFRSSRFARLTVLQELRERGLISEQLEWTPDGRRYSDAA